MPSFVNKAGVASPIPTGGGSNQNFTMDRARQNLFEKAGRKGPHWKDVVYGARHRTSIIGSQAYVLAVVRGMIPRTVEFEVRPDKWVTALDHKPDNADTATAIELAVRTLALFRSESNTSQVPFRTSSEIMGTTGEGYGIDFAGRNGKPAVAIVHTKAINILKNGDAEWFKREDGPPVIIPKGSFERLFVEDETFVDDCTSPFRSLSDDLATFEIINAALRAGGTADLVSRGLVWAPSAGPNEQANWIGDYMDVVEQVRRDPTVLGGLVPFPVTTGAKAPEYVDLGNIQETLIKSHELFVDVIARGSPMPAKLVKDGPGEGNAYADTLLQKHFLQFTAAPLLEDHVYPDIACWWWHPRLQRNAQYAATGIDPSRFRIKGNVSHIANRPDSRKEALAAHIAGILKKEFVAAQMGASEDDILRVGTPEHDEWLKERMATAANAANGMEERINTMEDDEPPIDQEGVTSGDEIGARFSNLRFEEIAEKLPELEKLSALW